jgi:uncharacterized membrane protein YwaF
VDEDLDAVALQKAFEFAARSVVLVCVLSILFRTSVLTPAHLDTHLPHHYTAASFFAQTIYGVRGLTAWVVIGILWTFCSAFAVVLYPLYESRIPDPAGL